MWRVLRGAGWVALGAAMPLEGQPRPVADHHQHLFSPSIAQLLSAAGGAVSPITAERVIALLDSAGIRRAALLSVGYMYGSPARQVDDEYAKVRAENDWTASEAERFPDRLRALCSVNPLKDYAVDEIKRCAADPRLRHGIKLHFGNSDVQLDDSLHLAAVRRAFQAANEHRLAIVVHLRASISRRRPYGATQANLFLDRVLPDAPDVPVQIAHLAGTGPGYDDPPADSALAAIATAMERGDPRTARLWVDVATSVTEQTSAATAALVARRIRAIGVDRVLFGSDAATPVNLRPLQSWEAFRRLPLTEAEFATIARNVAPFLR